MGDLIKIPHSEETATLELLDRLGVTQNDFALLRKASSWDQRTVARVLTRDSSMWAALELEEALMQVGVYPQELLKLARSGDLLEMLPQHSSRDTILHAIDCDASPFVPDGWSVLPDAEQLPNRVKGIFTWDPSRISLSKGQKGDKYILGNDLRKELASRPVFTANVLDYLLTHPYLIPEDWKKDKLGNTRFIFFWGTVYRRSGSSLCVRCLCWIDGGWDWSYCWLGGGFDSDCLALVRAS